MTTDTDPTVKNASELLSTLLKDIVTENTLYYPPELSNINLSDTEGSAPNSKDMRVPGSQHSQLSLNSYFTMHRFIGLISERMSTLNPNTRIFIMNWISVLSTVPDLGIQLSFKGLKA
jgi:vacuole morphology and inheritance protein 14